jgi:hypothetical protein
MISTIGFCFGLQGYYKKVFLDVKLGIKKHVFGFAFPDPSVVVL